MNEYTATQIGNLAGGPIPMRIFHEGAIDGNNIVWQTDDGSNSQIFLYNGTETIQLTDNDVNDFNSRVLGDSVVWLQGTTQSEEPISIVLATPNNNLNSTATIVYRFLNQDTGVHFYTASEIEKNAVEQLANFSFEGASYQGVDPLTSAGEPIPVYRFLNEDTGVHLYTTSENERNAVEELDNFSFEGEAFSAYETEVDGSIPVYRFFNSITGAHFYTPSATERDSVDDLSEYQSEGIAYYALPASEII